MTCTVKEVLIERARELGAAVNDEGYLLCSDGVLGGIALYNDSVGLWNGLSGPDYVFHLSDPDSLDAFDDAVLKIIGRADPHR
jgi:hypothetical protein